MNEGQAMNEVSNGAVAMSMAPVSRRKFVGRCAAAPVAVIAAGVLAPTAASAATGGSVTTYKGKYSLDGHRIVNGFFARPRGRTGLDVIVVVSESGALDAAAEAKARSYAAQGWLAIAPDLPSTYKGASIAGKAAMVESLMADMPRLKRLSRASGKVALVAA